MAEASTGMGFTEGITTGGVVGLIGTILLFARNRDKNAGEAAGAANKLLLSRVVELEKQQALFLQQISNLQRDLSHAEKVIVQQKAVIDGLTADYKDALDTIKRLRRT